MSDPRVQSPTVRVPGGGQAGRNAWRRYAALASAGAPPTEASAAVNGERQEDMIWLARVENAAGERVDGRTFTLGFGRLAVVEGPTREVAGSVLAVDELIAVDPAARPDLVYQQPALGDRVVAWLHDAGTVDTGAGERVVLYYKGWARLS